MSSSLLPASAGKGSAVFPRSRARGKKGTPPSLLPALTGKGERRLPSFLRRPEEGNAIFPTSHAHGKKGKSSSLFPTRCGIRERRLPSFPRPVEGGNATFPPSRAQSKKGTSPSLLPRDAGKFREAPESSVSRRNGEIASLNSASRRISRRRDPRAPGLPAESPPFSL